MEECRSPSLVQPCSFPARRPFHTLPVPLSDFQLGVLAQHPDFSRLSSAVPKIRLKFVLLEDIKPSQSFTRTAGGMLSNVPSYAKIKSDDSKKVVENALRKNFSKIA